MLRGIQCSCMSILSVCWPLFKFISIWDSFDLDCILQKGIFWLNLSIITDILGWKTYHRSFYWKFVNKCTISRYKNRRDNCYSISCVYSEIVNDCQQKDTRAQLISNNYLLGLLWGKQCFFLFDSHGKNEIERMSATDAASELSFKIHFAINMLSVAKLLAHRRRKCFFKNWKHFLNFPM